MGKDIIINTGATLIDSLKIMDRTGKKLLIVCDGDSFIGVISIGDIQRSIINKVDLNEPVVRHLRKDVLFARSDEDLQRVKERMLKERIESMPVVDPRGKLVDIIDWNDAFENEYPSTGAVGCPVVIMAGGKGERLKPLTNVLPKPLIPVSGKTIIEEIIDLFLKASCNRFYLSVNYKAETIKEYFDGIDDKNYSVEYIREDKPLGTAGSLYLLKDVITETFIVSNCDALIDVDLRDLTEYHKSNGNIATLVSVVKEFSIPYGVVETTRSGELVELKEKPDMIYQVNCGLYVLEPKVFDYISDNTYLNITDLLTQVKADGGRVGVFPISEKSWRDMGNWEEYLKMINTMR
ncbi:MAG: nucleotidyltransferase family protein [Clostridia bacterium]|nr:nucleotidyltransferase family protein [Clostridia bacterium]